MTSTPMRAVRSTVLLTDDRSRLRGHPPATPLGYLTSVPKGVVSVDTADSMRDLLTEVVLARGALDRQRRRTPVVRIDLGVAQSRLAEALRAFQSALRAEGAPMPYRLRDELRLLESLGRSDAGR